MSECEHYSNFERTDTSGEINSSQQQRESHDIKIPCCTKPSAKNELFHKNMVGSVVAGDPLKCNGELSKCPLNK